ncbi:MAG: hypothetical protein II161_05350 [Erysipelotrichaceae bacterium]|nr:hypothetical protein [Erysipelotrichaceae bacterium]
MKKIMISLMVLLLIVGCSGQPRYQGSADNPKDITDSVDGRSYSASRLILVVSEGTGEQQLNDLAARYSMTARPLMDKTIIIFESSLPFKAADLAAIRDEIAQNAFVQSVEYDYVVNLIDPVEPLVDM